MSEDRPSHDQHSILDLPTSFPVVNLEVLPIILLAKPSLTANLIRLSVN